MISQPSSPDTISLLKSSLNTSRTTRMVRSGSPWSRAGAEAVLAFFSMLSHWAASRVMSRSSSASAAPSAAVRTITPAFSGVTFFSICLSLVRSVSGSLRLMPVIDAPGT